MMDVHTHTPRKGAIYNLTLEELIFPPSYPDGNQWLSVGIHPWKLTENWRSVFEMVQKWAVLPQVLAIGETGLDKVVNTPCQEEAFKAHALLAENVRKPLIVHCVKAVDELLRIRKEIKPSQPWVFHGFRGKPQQAEQLLKAGFYLSFGEHFNAQSVLLCPADLLCVETDESSLKIEEITERICQVRKTHEESFAKDLFLK